VNSAALKAAHITDDTPDPPNARIGRDGQHHLSGILNEANAEELVHSVIPPLSLEERVIDLKAALERMTRLGITSLMDASVTPEIAETYQIMDKRGILGIRSNLCLHHSPTEDDDAQFERFVAERSQPEQII
ncbi:MAG: amidohydrolase family protein, partial [Terriglobales bacterium]